MHDQLGAVSSLGFPGELKAIRRLFIRGGGSRKGWRYRRMWGCVQGQRRVLLLPLKVEVGSECEKCRWLLEAEKVRERTSS